MHILNDIKRFGKCSGMGGEGKGKENLQLPVSECTLGNPLVHGIILLVLYQWNLNSQFCNMFSFQLVVRPTDYFHV